MRRTLAFIALMSLFPLSAGCRHVAGACDCEHSGYSRDVNDPGLVGRHGRSGAGCVGCGLNGTTASPAATPLPPPPPPPAVAPAPLPK